MEIKPLFAALRPPKRGFRPEQAAETQVFLGFRGDQSLTAGVLELSKPFAECLGLEEGPVEVQATTAPLAKTVLVQPNSVDDFEVVELQAEFIEEHLLNQGH